MNLQGERLIPASVERTWTALNDPDTLKACIAGCQSIERTDENQYLCTMAVRIGPVNARFKGKLQLTDIVAMESYRINFDGQGGVAGFGKGHADVRLAGDEREQPDDGPAQVGGKIAQIGSRLVESAAAKIADDFFKAFEARMRSGTGEAPAAAAETAPSVGAATFGAAAAGNAAAGAAVAGAGAANAQEAAAARAGLPGSERAMGASMPSPTQGGSRGMLWWIIGIIALVLIAWAAFG